MASLCSRVPSTKGISTYQTKGVPKNSDSSVEAFCVGSFVLVCFAFFGKNIRPRLSRNKQEMLAMTPQTANNTCQGLSRMLIRVYPEFDCAVSQFRLCLPSLVPSTLPHLSLLFGIALRLSCHSRWIVIGSGHGKVQVALDSTSLGEQMCW